VVRGAVPFLIGLAILVPTGSTRAAPGDLPTHRVTRRADGRVTFLAAEGERSLWSPRPGERTPPRAFLRVHGGVFGVSDADRQLEERESWSDVLGRRHTRFEQRHRGVRVMGGELRVHQNERAEVTAANGDIFPVPEHLETSPGVPGALAAQIARQAAGLPAGRVEESELVIVDPGWYGDPPRGARLAYRLVLADASGMLRESFFVDAADGTVLDQWSLDPSSLVREVRLGSTTGPIVRAEEDPPPSDPPDADRVFDYAGDVYGYLLRGFGRLGVDGADSPIRFTVHEPAACPFIAYWSSGSQTAHFCANTTGDDLVAHELTHGVVQHTAGLVYQNESGMLNEAYADIFGELVDLLNGNAAFSGAPGGPPWPVTPTGPGTDTPNDARSTCSPPVLSYPDGVRWLISEDTPIGAIRDLWDPTCLLHPDRVSSPFLVCDPNDNGGVHNGSGVLAHAFALATDGGSFNGHSVAGIGPVKTGAVWFQALDAYLTPFSDFADAYDAIYHAALDAGFAGAVPDPRPGASAAPFGIADFQSIVAALDAVELGSAAPSCNRGACCNAGAGTCQDYVTAGECSGTFLEDRTCSSVTSTCTLRAPAPPLFWETGTLSGTSNRTTGVSVGTFAFDPGDAGIPGLDYSPANPGSFQTQAAGTTLAGTWQGTFRAPDPGTPGLLIGSSRGSYQLDQLAVGETVLLDGPLTAFSPVPPLPPFPSDLLFPTLVGAPLVTALNGATSYDFSGPFVLIARQGAAGSAPLLSPGAGQTGSLLAGSGAPGGVDFALDVTIGGELAASHALVSPSVVLDGTDETPSAVPQLSSLVSTWTLGFSGAFDPPAILTFGYDERDVPSGVAEADLGIFALEDGELVPVPSAVDPATDRITVSAAALGGFVLAGALPACGDGVDNDGDGQTDAGSDAGCAGVTDASERSPLFVCDDGNDNDGDGAIDFRPGGGGDPGCASAVAVRENPVCQDGLDNDHDGRKDWDGGASAGLPVSQQTQPDPQCTTSWRNLERAGCGLGFEVALVIPLLAQGFARARRGARKGPRVAG
jgi:Zn-dependent metalloprotease